jgi:hypothetical protein
LGNRHADQSGGRNCGEGHGPHLPSPAAAVQQSSATALLWTIGQDMVEASLGLVDVMTGHWVSARVPSAVLRCLWLREYRLHSLAQNIVGAETVFEPAVIP